MAKFSRIDDIQPFHVMALLARAKELEAQGRDIVHMEVGEPDFPTPQPIVNAGMEAIRQGDVHYTSAVGLPELRQAIADFYQSRYQVSVTANRIVITPGASGALMLALGVVMKEGDEVLLPDPGYPCNRNFVRFLSGKTRSIEVDASSGYQLTLKHLKDNWQENTAAVIVASPSNPTGTLIARDELMAMADFVKTKEAWLIVDEIYHGLVYENEVSTALNINDNIIVINSFSKYFNMTGWRVGWLVAPVKLVSDLDKLAQNIFLAAPTPAQYAALAAFHPETITILENYKKEFKHRRDYLLPELKKLGFKIEVEPQGAFYIYANCEKFSHDSYQFAYELLENIGVAITPGKDFGENKANTFVRFAYTVSIDKLKEGVKRLAGYLAEKDS
ncbi:MAG: pyridoxal phosphate-dependent aminotransferase [Gammaproteobacteria bacterium]|nr:pyridoxal phosphate-dependent aminotransferase [Gammaproteobacteria bacterium]